MIDQYLFAEPGKLAYALIDGASVPNILASLAELNTPGLCLQRGELSFEEALTAAYLLELTPGSKALSWFLQGWGQHRGVLVLADIDIASLRDHFRRFLIVYDECGQPMKFRFYDPRVLRSFLQICSDKQYHLLFESVDQLLVESATAGQIMRFFPALSGRKNVSVPLAQGGE